MDNITNKRLMSSGIADESIGTDEANGADESNGVDEANGAGESNQMGNGVPDEAMGDTEATIPSEQPNSRTAPDEGFFDLFSRALSVTGPMGMIAGIGMSAVGHVLRNHRESAFDEAYSSDGVAERALLGEASLATIIKLGPAKCRTLGIFDRMLPIVSKLQPTCRRVGPMVMPFVMEPAWRTTGGGLNLPQKPNGEADVEPKRIPTSDDTNTTGFGPRLNANAEAFINALTESLTSQDTEAFTNTEFGWGNISKTALRVAGPILGSVLESGLTRLEVGDETGNETGVDPSPEADVNNPETSQYAYDAMTQRAIAAEASLGALLQTPVESL